MKNLLSVIFLLFVWNAQAQSFEGTIRWSMKADITDPATKAKLEDAQKKMNSPEAQANMKKMQDKMNDPQFKTMMESNPQLKAQMEMAMKSIGGGDPTSMMPTGMVMKVKGDNVDTKLEGGAMAFETLYSKDADKAYMINRDAKTYSVLPSGPGGADQTEAAPKVTKTSETMKILGYNCTKYIVEITEHGRTINEIVWTTTEIKNFDFKKFAKVRAGKNSMYVAGLDGAPLRFEVKDPSANIIMEVTEIKAESLPASDFAVPADFKQTQGMFMR